MKQANSIFITFFPLEAESTCSGISSSISTCQGLFLTSNWPISWANILNFYSQIYSTDMGEYILGAHPDSAFYMLQCFQDAIDRANNLYIWSNFMVIHLLGVWSGLSLPYTVKYLCFPPLHPTPIIWIRTSGAYSDLIGNIDIWPWKFKEKKNQPSDIFFSAIFRDVLVN